MRLIPSSWIWGLIGLTGMIVSCIKPYTPSILNSGNKYLVVDGFINTQPGGITTLALSRTRNVLDTLPPIPELGAQISIESSQGALYILLGQDSKGNYASNALNLDPSVNYRLNITTNQGEKYQSDYIIPKDSPPIDSISWIRNNGVQILVNTHDSKNSTHYYRWIYDLTWEYHSKLSSPYAEENGIVYIKSPENQTDTCYPHTFSTQVLIANSSALSNDIISEKLLKTIPNNDSMLFYGMSVLVSQYALSPASFAYWNIIQKNSQSLGTLFDLQPSILTGNIHSLTRPIDPVIGYIQAGKIQQFRIFISHNSLPGWKIDSGGTECLYKKILVDQLNPFIYMSTDNTYGPYYFISGGPLVIAKKGCLDCRINGQTNIKPSYWKK